MSDIDVYKEWLGIPEDKRPPDLYDLLRLVQFEDDAEKINEHYKKLNAHVRKYATGAYSVRSQELLNELAKAMLCLTDSERKREYDESLGREFDDEDEGRKPLLKILAEAGTIDRSQISEIEDFADARGLSHCDAVVQMKLVEREAATRALSQELGIPFIDLEDMLPDDSVLDRVPKNLVKRHSFLPLFEDDGVLLVACADEPEPELEDAIRMRFGIPMRAGLATTRAINQSIAKYYAPGERNEVVDEPSAASTSTGKGKKDKKPKSKPKKTGKTSAPFSSLPPEEQREKRMLGIIIICWAMVGSIWVSYLTIGLLPWGVVVTIIATAIAAAYVFLSMWK